MIWLVSFGFGLAGIVIAFFKPALAWVVLALPLGWILVMWLAVRPDRIGPIPEISPGANELLRRFGHYYAHPSAGSAYSSTASGITLASLVVAAIGAFKGFWWGLAIGALAYWLAAFLARQFNPTNFLVNDRERAAHDELLAAVQPRHPRGGAG